MFFSACAKWHFFFPGQAIYFLKCQFEYLIKCTKLTFGHTNVVRSYKAHGLQALGALWHGHTAIFLIKGLCIVYCSLLQCLTLVYPRWGQKSEFFCLLVTTRRLQSGTVVDYRSTTTAYCWYTAAKGH